MFGSDFVAVHEERTLHQIDDPDVLDGYVTCGSGRSVESAQARIVDFLGASMKHQSHGLFPFDVEEPVRHCTA
jgi:hypothetical protein